MVALVVVDRIKTVAVAHQHLVKEMRAVQVLPVTEKPAAAAVQVE
jgi:hypothetical protein